VCRRQKVKTPCRRRLQGVHFQLCKNSLRRLGNDSNNYNNDYYGGYDARNGTDDGVRHLGGGSRSRKGHVVISRREYWTGLEPWRIVGGKQFQRYPPLAACCISSGCRGAGPM
jgi:hypothetical protein